MRSDTSLPRSAIGDEIWDMKYRFKRGDGSAVDATIEDTWTRVAGALAEAEKPEAREDWARRFREALEGYRFLPAGRILAGAGTGRAVTLFNCFVMGTIADDLAGIFDGLKESALTMQQGGGIGCDFSSLRPKGAPVRGVGADASGPLSFMDVWDAMCRTIMSAGSRRGAMMATMACDHPDIEAFIEAKRDPGRLRMFNLSVLVTDAFMAAVERGDDWPLMFDGTCYKTVKAAELWDRIMRSTYDYAEPGVIFIDRVNEQNNLGYCETVRATNPCVTAETWIHTVEGPRRVSDLVGEPFVARIDGQDHPSTPQGFFPTGVKPVVRLATEHGPGLRLTSDHPVRKVIRRTRWRLEWEWTAAGTLRRGDEVLLGDHSASRGWRCTAEERGAFSAETGYLLGLLIGDGTLKQDGAVLSAWPGRAVVNGGFERPGVTAVMEAAFEAARTLPHRADFSGWYPVPGRGEYRMKLVALTNLAQRFGLVPGGKTITPAIEEGSSEFCANVLRGVFDADGSVQGDQKKGLSIRLAQSDLECLKAAQRMLLRMGIVARIYENRRGAGRSLLPDGRGGRRYYATKAQHELVVSSDNLLRFAERIGFGDSEKAARLRTGLNSCRRRLNRERFVTRVTSVTPDGEAEVFDAQVPGINAFDANGITVHNCGEQPLPPYGACLLGSINLAALIARPFGEEAGIDEEELDRLVRIAVRMMDNVIDVSNYPLEAQRHEAHAKRRIGLGVTGLADALIMCGLRYGTDAAADRARGWMAAIERSAYLASADLAAEKGAFPLFDKKAYLTSGHVRGLGAEIREAIGRNGIRNALLTSIAPTGTISLFADNVSSGIEPVFSYHYERKVLQPDGSRLTETVSDLAYRRFVARFGEEAPLPPAFVTTQELKPHDHVVMQAALQPHVDSSISKTVNVPETISFEAFKDVYREAYERGLKGCTTYRPNAITGAVLTAEPEPLAGGDQAALPLEAPALPTAASGADVVYMKQPLERQQVLPGFTYKLRWPDSDHAIYVTLNDIVEDGRRRPFEIFINSKNMEHYAWTVALTRMISAVFRRGGDVSFVVEELKAVFDPRGGQWMGGRYVPSLLAAIGEVIERHMIDTGFLARDADEKIVRHTGTDEHPAEVSLMGAKHCPKCSAPTLIFQEGCHTCLSCGHSKCS